MLCLQLRDIAAQLSQGGVVQETQKGVNSYQPSLPSRANSVSRWSALGTMGPTPQWLSESEQTTGKVHNESAAVSPGNRNSF